jgi:hypothetical protein
LQGVFEWARLLTSAAAREKARTDLARLTVELEQVEAALALQARAAKPHRSRSGRKQGNTRKRVLDIVASGDGPMSPAQIRQVMTEQGKALSGGGLYTLIKRLVDEGELRKIADGQYTLPTPNETDSTGPTQNGARGPLSTVPLFAGLKQSSRQLSVLKPHSQRSAVPLKTTNQCSLSDMHPSSRRPPEYDRRDVAICDIRARPTSPATGGSVPPAVLDRRQDGPLSGSSWQCLGI